MPRTYLFFVLGLFLMCFVPVKVDAQKNAAISKEFVGLSLPQSQAKTLNQSFSTFATYELSLASIDQFVKENSSPQIRLQLGGEYDWTLLLEAHDIRSADYQAYAQTENGKELLPFTENVTYKARLLGKDQGTARITLTPDFIYGFVQTKEETFYIEPLRRFEPSVARNQVIVYPKSALIAKNIACGLTDERSQEQLIEQELNGEQQRVSSGCITLELAIAHDLSMFQKYRDISSLHAYTLGVMNSVEAVYSQGSFQDDIQFKVVEQYSPICEDCDLWTSSREAIVLLEDFTDWAKDDNFSATHDLGQLWTNRDLVGSTVGLAYVGTVCGSSKYHILQDFSSNADITRVTTAHEIGHNLNASHNATSQGNIMDPTVNSTTTWSAATIATINNKLSAVSCLQACGQTTCPAVEKLVINDLSPNEVSLSWGPSAADRYDVSLFDVASNTLIYTTHTTNTTITLNPPLDLCKDYILSVASNCGNAEMGTLTSVKFQTSFNSFIEITAATPTNCGAGRYDLEVVIEHRDKTNSGFRIVVDGVAYQQNFGSSPQTLMIRELEGDGNPNVELEAIAATNGSPSCSAVLFYKAPGKDCSLEIFENFNGCELPPNWSNTNTTRSSGGISSIWAFADENRTVANLPKGTIDGTCMAYFDDDLYNNIGGTMELLSPVMNLSNYSNLTLEFDYSFFSFEQVKSAPNHVNDSQFKVEVWDGMAWRTILLEEHNNDCSWREFWSCPHVAFSINVEAYKNEELQVKFTYDDGGKWAGGIGIDNFKISGKPACSRPNDIQTTSSILTADYECTDAYGWTHYWKTGSPDILLLSLKKNDDPTLSVRPEDVKVGVDFANLVQNIPATTPYVQSSNGWDVMSRYWQVNVTTRQQPTNPVEVRFYYTKVEIDAIISASRGTSVEEDMIWYKFASNANIDPDPSKGHLNAVVGDFIALTPTFGSFADHHYAEFTVNSFSGGGGGSGAGFLPISLVDFEGRYEEERVHLDWRTEWEEFNSHFLIERSDDGITYKEIGKVNSKSNAGGRYNFSDEEPLYSVSYYRLKQVDYDGAFSYSKIITLYPDLEDDIVIATPNPTSDHTVLNIQAAYGEDMTIEVFELTGKLLFQTSIKTKPGANQFRLETAEYTPGIYLVHVRKQKSFSTLKLMVK